MFSKPFLLGFVAFVGIQLGQAYVLPYYPLVDASSDLGASSNAGANVRYDRGASDSESQDTSRYNTYDTDGRNRKSKKDLSDDTRIRVPNHYGGRPYGGLEYDNRLRVANLDTDDQLSTRALNDERGSYRRNRANLDRGDGSSYQRAAYADRRASRKPGYGPRPLYY